MVLKRGRGRRKEPKVRILTMKAAFMVKILTEGPFFAAKAAISKPNDRVGDRSTGILKRV